MSNTVMTGTDESVAVEAEGEMEGVDMASGRERERGEECVERRAMKI